MYFRKALRSTRSWKCTCGLPIHSEKCDLFSGYTERRWPYLRNPILTLHSGSNASGLAKLSRENGKSMHTIEYQWKQLKVQWKSIKNVEKLYKLAENQWKSEDVDGRRQEIDDYQREVLEMTEKHRKIVKLGAKGCPRRGTVHSNLQTTRRDDASYARFLVNLSKLW